MQTDATSANNSQYCWVLLANKCCVRLHGPKNLTGFKLYATSANIVVVSCKRTQQVNNIVGPKNFGCCWPTMWNPFAWALRVSCDRQTELREDTTTNISELVGLHFVNVANTYCGATERRSTVSWLSSDVRLDVSFRK